ncbi:MAG: preprotein translocase subunit SecF [Clostridiales bacterium]|jgi:preprotein translocase subunit SecF|nr:preprotein translocase subunit SecF [Clostridiales bacterium]MDN5280972.1 preprotein translocase subunit SecF [Candidatus Ozemobacter sp.]
MNLQFMKHRYTFFGISIALIIVSVLLLAIKGLNYGIDFKGGSIIHVRFESEMNETKIRDIFKSIEKNRSLYFTSDQLIIQSVASGMGKEFIIQYPAAPVDSQKNSEIHDFILSDLKAAAPYSDEALEVSNVGPTVGEEMKKQGIQAAIISVIGILLYLAYRFEFQSATGAIVAIVHDLIITLGFLAMIGVEFDITVLAGILTLLGYSVNDSIVILDRIRENRKFAKDNNFANLINDSINQTLGRTLNTSITTLLALFSLLWLGGISIWGFALTLTFGVIIGTYSSVFVASPVLLEMTGEKLGRAK